MRIPLRQLQAGLPIGLSMAIRDHAYLGADGYAAIDLGTLSAEHREQLLAYIARPAISSQLQQPVTPAAVERRADDEDELELLRAAADPEGWGDHVAAVIHRMGADRAYSLVRKLAGATGSCRCNARRRALNRLEGWVRSVFA